MSSTEIKLNKEQANYGIEQLKQCQRELYEADKLFYKGIMALASAKGMDLILKEDAGINLYMPEKIVIECREEVATLIEEISSKLALVQDFNEEPKEGTDTVQYRKTGTGEEVVKAPGAQPLYGVPTPERPIEGGTTGPIQALYAPPPAVEPIEVTPGAQPLYGVPTPVQPIEGGITGPIQALYAPPGIEPIEVTPGAQPLYGVPTPGVVGPIEGGVVPGPIQALYAPPGVVGPIEGGVVPGPIQALYAPPGVIGPIEGGIDPGPIQALYAPPGIEPSMPVQPMYGVITPSDPVVQPMYGVITPSDPVVQPMYGVITPSDPIVGPIEGGVNPGPIQALYAPPGIPDPGVGAPATPEYETIPNTGIPGVIEKNYVSKHPRLIGGLAATIGLFGIPTMLSDDFDEEEEKRLNGKED